MQNFSKLIKHWTSHKTTEKEQKWLLGKFPGLVIYNSFSINQTTEPLQHSSITTDIDLQNSLKVKLLK